MTNTNENKNSLLNDEEFEDRRNHNDREMSDEELNALLDDFDDDDDDDDDDEPEQAEKPVKAKQSKAEPPAPTPAREESLLSKTMKAIESPELVQEISNEHYLKRLAEIGETPSKKKFTGVLEQEFERINKVLTLSGIPPDSRNLKKFGKLEYKHEAQKGHYGIVEQKASLNWLWVHHRETVLDMCSTDHECILEFFSSEEYNDDLAHEIATLQGNVDHSKGRANYLGSAKKCELLGLPDYIQRELSVFHSATVKKEKLREAKAKQKEVGKIAKQERENAERLRKIKIQLANDRRKLEEYREANRLRNGLDPDLDELWNVRLAMSEVGDDSKKRSKAMSIYKNATGKEPSPYAFSRRIDYLKRASIL